MLMKSAPLSTSSLTEILSGKRKPTNEKEALSTMSAMLWKKAYESALSSPFTGDQDALSAPESSAIKDHQATWMGVQAAHALSESLNAQLKYTAQK
jgi:hypothetical protein